MEKKLSDEEFELFYYLRNYIQVMAKDIENDNISHTDAASSILSLSDYINWVYEQMAKK